MADIQSSCIPGAKNYRANDAPCICVTGKDKEDLGPDGKLLNHGRIHRRMDLAEGQAAKAGGWTYTEAEKAGAESVAQVVPGCTEACIAAQLQEYHVNLCKMEPETKLRAHTRSEGWMSKAQKEIAAENRKSTHRM